MNLPLQTIVHAIRFLRQKVNGMIAFDAVLFDRKGQFKLHYPCEEREGYCVTFGLFYQGPVLHVGILGNCDGKSWDMLEEDEGRVVVGKEKASMGSKRSRDDEDEERDEEGDDDEEEGEDDDEEERGDGEEDDEEEGGDGADEDEEDGEEDDEEESVQQSVSSKRSLPVRGVSAAGRPIKRPRGYGDDGDDDYADEGDRRKRTGGGGKPKGGGRALIDFRSLGIRDPEPDDDGTVVKVIGRKVNKTDDFRVQFNDGTEGVLSTIYLWDNATELLKKKYPNVKVLADSLLTAFENQNEREKEEEATKKQPGEMRFDLPLEFMTIGRSMICFFSIVFVNSINFCSWCAFGF